jgi:hypothetical protein
MIRTSQKILKIILKILSLLFGHKRADNYKNGFLILFDCIDMGFPFTGKERVCELILDFNRTMAALHFEYEAGGLGLHFCGLFYLLQYKDQIRYNDFNRRDLDFWT